MHILLVPWKQIPLFNVPGKYDVLVAALCWWVAMQETNFKAGEVLGSDGTDGEYIYLIAQGQVDVLRSTTSTAPSEQLADADDDIADAPPCQYFRVTHTCMLCCCCLCVHGRSVVYA